MTKHELVAKITKVVRAADEEFKDVGGSTRHWVRDCLLPGLEEAGLQIVDTETIGAAVLKLVEWLNTPSYPSPTGSTKIPVVPIDIEDERRFITLEKLGDPNE